MNVHCTALALLCERCDMRRLALFGAALREDFGPTRSDLGFAMGACNIRGALAGEAVLRIQRELEDLLGRSVNLIRLRARQNG